MSSRPLQTGVLEGGVRTVNFFNGRPLTSEDLIQERTANRAFDTRLGLALGSGVAYGLEVTAAPPQSDQSGQPGPTVAVAPGLAINSLGQSLGLASPIDLALTRPSPADSTGPADFGPCAPPQASVPVAATGVYVLVIGPATQRVGRAPASDPLGAGCGCRPVSDCQARDLVEGVQFRIVPLPLSTNELATGPLLRSLTARACLGLDDPLDLTPLIDPQGPAAPPGLVTRLRMANQITACEVPLAVLGWDAAAGLVFVDRWAVRRRPTRPALGTLWGTLLDDHQRTRSEALFLQFQEQAAELLALLKDPAALHVSQVFGHLPPVGFLPVATARTPGINPAIFFYPRGSTAIPQIDAGQVPALLEEGLTRPAIDAGGSDPIQLYLIRENALAVQSGVVSQLTLVFARADLPYRATARFDSALWDLSRFSPEVL
ncbi:MAG: hypothetical protein ACK5WR_04200 [Planctomycetaceae bacterium]|jgi:hypothetical protein